jgi:hypothetical protein
MSGKGYYEKPLRLKTEVLKNYWCCCCLSWTCLSRFKKLAILRAIVFLMLLFMAIMFFPVIGFAWFSLAGLPLTLYS